MRKLSNMKLLSGLFGATAAALVAAGCGEDSPVGDLAKQCGLTCEAKTLADGNFAISGIAKIDSFFAAVVNFDTQAKLIASNIRAELDAIALSVGAAKGASAAEIKSKLLAKFKLDSDAGLSIKYQPAKCGVSAKAVVEAQAKCEGKVEPGEVKVECNGSCQMEASAEASCSGNAKLVCHGTAPSLACEGTCQGSCELETAAKCEGTCKGTCDGECSVKDASGNCAGQCEGQCRGSCELTAGGKCEGKCKGECAYTPPSGKCEAGARVECKAEANAKVECNGKCDGEVTPPQASAECQASAKADAEVKVECTPPSVDVAYKFQAGLSAEAQAQAQAELEAWLVGFKASMGRIAAELKRGRLVFEAGGRIASSAEGAVKAALQGAAQGDVKTKVGIACALQALPLVPDIITKASTGLTAEVNAAAQLATSLGGSEEGVPESGGSSTGSGGSAGAPSTAAGNAGATSEQAGAAGASG